MDISENGCKIDRNFKTPKAELSKFLQTCIDNIIAKEGFLTHSIETKKISSNGANYLSVLYAVDIRGKTKFEEKEVNIFIKKVIPVSHSYSDCFSITELYSNECYFYKELSKIFKKLEKDADVSLEERYRIVKCYDESSSEALILENMAKKGFKLCNKKNMVPLKFTELSIQQLAKFHSFGFVIQKLMPDYFKNNISSIDDPLKAGNSWTELLKKSADCAMKYMNGDAKKKAEAIANKLNVFGEYRQDKSSILTLCHGDFKADNILVKEAEGEIKEVVPVDYQLVHYGCPVNDFLYFVYGCTDPQFRRRHFQHLIDMYYDTMSNYLKYFNIDVAEVCPRKEFDSALKNRPLYGAIIALSFYAFYYAPEDNPPDLTKDFDTLDIDVDLDVVKRIEETIDEIDKQCFL